MNIRQLEKQLSDPQRLSLAILREYECDIIENEEGLVRSISTGSLQLIAFSCPKSSRKSEDLEVQLDKSLFFERYAKDVARFMQVIEETGLTVSLLVIVSDIEPKRVWGWQTPQAEITGLCKLMIEDAVGSLPANWSIVCWSTVEADSSLYYADLYEQAIKLPETKRLAGEYQKYELQIQRFVRTGRQEYALGKAAQYAAEAQILRSTFPQAVLIQSERNAPLVKDKMYNLLGKSLPIIHPFM